MSAQAASSAGSVNAKPVSLPNPSKPVPTPLSLAESFMCGGLAGCAAVSICKRV